MPPSTSTPRPSPLPVAAGHPSETERYAAWLTGTAGLAATTARTYTGHLADYRRWWSATRDGHAIDAAAPADVEDYLAHLAHRGLRASTRRTALHALRAYYRWLDRHRDTTQDPDSATTAGPSGTVTRAQGAPTHAGVGTVDPGDCEDEPARLGALRPNPAAAVRRPRVPQPRTVIYTEAQADAVLTAAAAAVRTRVEDSSTPVDDLARAELEHAVLAPLRWTGLRPSELCGLLRDDLDLHSALLQVQGKGSKHRVVPLPPRLAGHLDRYLAGARTALADGATSRRLFLNPASPTLQLTPRALLEICRRHGTRAQVPGPHHALRWRHSYATHTLSRGGVDLHSLARLLGHSSITTSERYLHLDTNALHDAVRRAYPRDE